MPPRIVGIRASPLLGVVLQVGGNLRGRQMGEPLAHQGSRAGHVGRLLGRDDFPDPDDPGLFRHLPQQRRRNVGFDVVLAHVPGRAAVVFQESHHYVCLPGQVNGHRDHPGVMNCGVVSSFLDSLPRLEVGDQLVEA